ncbi:MAG: glycosyltransferase family 39 protein [Anaerolineales bacterium]|nr:glycosyltransferase family 39 protein [Anaerolineales bacterium]
MEIKEAYPFPLYHRIGQMARLIIARRYWIVIVLIAAFLLYSPFLSAGFFQDDYGFRLEFSQQAYEKLGVPEGVSKEIMLNGPLNLYGFSSGGPTRFALSRDKGIMPWWASEEIKTNFFRPLSSLNLALDYSLWPDAPLLLHLHSILWFCLFLYLAYRLYRSISGSAVVAGISILLLALDDVFTGPAGWISNRHAVIAMVFCVVCVWLYHQGVSKQKWPALAWSYVVYTLALLASEMGLVAFAYLFAYMLVLDRDKWQDRIKRILPLILITVVWRVVYTALGYGASGTLLYIDPILDPADFIVQLLTRFPILLFSAVGAPVVELLLAFSPQGAAILAVVCLVPLMFLALAVYPVLKTHRTSAFWAIGLLVAVIPLVSGIPQNRNLGLVSLGVMGVAGQLFVDVAKAKKDGSIKAFWRLLLRLATPLLIILYVVVSPMVLLSNLSSTRTMAEDQAEVVDFGSDPELAQQHVYIINPTGTMSYVAGILQRLFTDEPIPASINYLSSGFTPVQIERVDGRTILVTPEGGYTPLPGPIRDKTTGILTHVHLENVYRALDENFYNPENPMVVGQVVTLSEVTAKVTEMTGDGRIAQAAFTFAHPLEDGRYVWLLWDEDSSGYQRVEMPAVGETRVYP